MRRDSHDAERQDNSDSIPGRVFLSSRENFLESLPAERNGRDLSVRKHPQIDLPPNKCASSSRRNSYLRPGRLPANLRSPCPSLNLARHPFPTPSLPPTTHDS